MGDFRGTSEYVPGSGSGYCSQCNLFIVNKIFLILHNVKFSLFCSKYSVCFPTPRPAPAPGHQMPAGDVNLPGRLDIRWPARAGGVQLRCHSNASTSSPRHCGEIPPATVATGGRDASSTVCRSSIRPADPGRRRWCASGARRRKPGAIGRRPRIAPAFGRMCTKTRERPGSRSTSAQQERRARSRRRALQVAKRCGCSASGRNEGGRPH